MLKSKACIYGIFVSIFVVFWLLKGNFVVQASTPFAPPILFTEPVIADVRFRYEPLLGKFDIQKFLKNRRSHLANLKIKGELASQIIDQASIQYEIAPQVLITLIQLHSGAIDSKSLSQDQVNHPLNLPAEVANGFKEQIDYSAQFLDQNTPRYYEDPNEPFFQNVTLKNGKIIQIPGSKSASESLVKLSAQTTDLDGLKKVYSQNSNDFISTYQNFFSTNPLSFPTTLAANLSGAKLPFSGSKWYTSGPHGINTTACYTIAVSDGSGIDFAETGNTSFKVLNILPGTLLSIDYDSPKIKGIGNRVRIKHSTSLVSEYWHLDSFSTEILARKVGDVISQGFPIGMSGKTGGQDAIHLHFELRTPKSARVQWDGSSIDNYQIGMNWLYSQQAKGYNYQGSAVVGSSKRLQLSGFCGGTNNYGLVGVNYNNPLQQNGLDSNTIFDWDYYNHTPGKLRSTNIDITAPTPTPTPSPTPSPTPTPTASWTTTGSMTALRGKAHGFRLENGKVLVFGGSATSSAEIFDPNGNGGIGSWTPTDSMSTVRVNSGAALLPNGKVLVVGGYDNNNNVLASAEIFDPNGNNGNGSWSTTTGMSSPRYLVGITMLPNGKVLVAGGHGIGTNVYTATSEIFNPDGNGGLGSWSTSANMTVSRPGPVLSLLQNGKVLATGGWNYYLGGSITTAEIFDPNGNNGAGSWTATASMINGRYLHTSTTLPSGKVLVVGGESTGQAPYTAEIYDPNGNNGTGSWALTSPFESFYSAISHHSATLLLNGKVLVTGFCSQTSCNTPLVKLFDPQINNGIGGWIPTASMAEARTNPTANLLQNGRVLVAGGSANKTAEIYTP